MTETTTTRCGKHAPGTCNSYGTECVPRHSPDEILARRRGLGPFYDLSATATKVMTRTARGYKSFSEAGHAIIACADAYSYLAGLARQNAAPAAVQNGYVLYEMAATARELTREGRNEARHA